MVTQSSGDLLAAVVRRERDKKRWTQEQLANEVGVSIDSIRRLESGVYILPTRPRSSGHVLDKVLEKFGLDSSKVIRECYSDSEILQSIYGRSLDSLENSNNNFHRLSPHALSLRDYIASLPTDRSGLLDQAALLNAHAVAFLIALERQFEAFEFLVTNQPPFVLFADDEYITTGSASTELADEDRQTYHLMIFDHREHARQLAKKGKKHYKVVLHKASLIGFLNARSQVRAERIIRDMQSYLKFDGFDLLVVDDPEPFDEFEVLSIQYPFDPRQLRDAISIRHRRVGVDNTLVYQLALIGTDNTLVLEDHSRAARLWRLGLDQYKGQPKSYSAFRKNEYGLEHKRITARLLEDALLDAHPKDE